MKLIRGTGLGILFLAVIASIVIISYPDYFMHTDIDSTESTSTFRQAINQAVEEINAEQDSAYILDELSYDERDATIYLRVMQGISKNDITAAHIKEVFNNLFFATQYDGKTYFMQKENEDLILECPDINKANVLDYEYMGTTNDELNSKSKNMFISQNSSQNELIKYGDSNIKASGCGVICLTTAINYVNEAEVVGLYDVLKWADEHDMYEENSGTRWALFRDYPKTVSTVCEEIYVNSADEMESLIQDGEVLIVSMDKGHFTEGGHFIIITEIKDGAVSVIDPTSICRSLTTWDAQLILDESKHYFWKISKQ